MHPIINLNGSSDLKNEFSFNSQTTKITTLLCNKHCCDVVSCHPYGIFSTCSVKRKEKKQKKWDCDGKIERERGRERQNFHVQWIMMYAIHKNRTPLLVRNLKFNLY